MEIPSNYIIIVDVIIVAIFVLSIIFSYKNGFLYELLSLFFIVISLFFGYFLSPIVASRLYLVNPPSDVNPIINTNMIYYSVNVIIWFVILSIVFILIFLLIKPIFKKLTKVPIIGWVDKIFGLIFGFVKAIIICTLLSCLLSTSLIKNGKEVKEKSIIKYVDIFTSKTINFIAENIDYTKLDENLSEIDMQNTRKVFEEWLIEQGFINE